MSDVGERMAKLEADVKNIDKKVDDGFRDSKERHGELKSNIVAIGEKMDEFIKAADARYATKESSWAEPLLSKVGIAVIIAIVLAILGLIFTFK